MLVDDPRPVSLICEHLYMYLKKAYPEYPKYSCQLI